MEDVVEPAVFEWGGRRDHSEFRPAVFPDPQTGRLVPAKFLLTTKRVDPSIGARLYPEHRLYWAPRATFAVEAAFNVWHVRAGRAVWVPANHPHEVFLRAHDVANVTAFDPALVKVPWDMPSATLMPRPQRALLEWGRDNGMARSSRLRMQRTIVDLTLPTSPSRIDLRIPRDPRLARLTREIMAEPRRIRSIAKEAARLGMTERTLTRRFRQETGESLGSWRSLALLRNALPLLADDMPVWMVATESGYRSPSAFAAAFRRSLGISPRELLTPDDGTDAPPMGALVGAPLGEAVEFAR